MRAALTYNEDEQQPLLDRQPKRLGSTSAARAPGP